MNDKQNNLHSKQALEALDWDIQPARDLWPDIHSRIRFAGKPDLSLSDELPVAEAPTDRRTGSVIPWAPMGIAACLMLAFGAFVMSTLSYQRSQATYELQASFIDYQKSQISLIEQQHAHVRAQFVDMLAGVHGPVDPVLAAEVRSVLLTIDKASLELKQAILAEPLNKNYATMLARTYQEELKLLNRFKTRDGITSNEVSL